MTRAERKWDHIRYALKTGLEANGGFEDLSFVHQSLPNTSLNRIHLSTKIGELRLSSPIFINAMTGGGGQRTADINQNLAMVAKETGLAMAVGSQMAAIKNQQEIETFKIVRRVNPNGVMIGNLGWEASVDQAKKAVEMIEADALQIHLNAVQELTMPEGDRDFKGALQRIERIVQNIGVPVIAKEVGFGMGMETVQQLADIGVSAVDVGGFGGTNFSKIENERREHPYSFFDDWGISTPISIAEAKECQSKIMVLGSGGIKNSLEVAKALSLGADAVGMAGFFLKILLSDGLDTLVEKVNQLHHELSVIMAALGANTIEDLQQVPLVISGKTHHWLTERGIDTKKHSQRGLKRN